MINLVIELEVTGGVELSLDVPEAVELSGFDVWHTVPIIPSNYGLITYDGHTITVS